MNTIAVDTHKTIRKLVEQGFTEKQAEGVVAALTESDLVTRDYLDRRLAEVQLNVIKWIAAMLVAQSAAIVALQELIK